jgi:aspartate racemase
MHDIISKIFKNNTQKPIIGILGGMSSYSTIKFYEELIRLSHKNYHIKQNEKLPQILIYDIAPPIFPSTEETVDLIMKGVKKLQLAKSNFLTIPCNTTHVLLKEIKKQVKIPLISIIDATVEQIIEQKLDTIAILGTKITINSNLYQKQLQKNCIKTIIPSLEDQKKIDKILKKITLNQSDKQDKNILIKIINKTKKRGAQGAILGCTELSLIIKQKDSDIILFDTLLILAKKSLKQYYAT